MICPTSLRGGLRPTWQSSNNAGDTKKLFWIATLLSVARDDGYGRWFGAKPGAVFINRLTGRPEIPILQRSAGLKTPEKLEKAGKMTA